MSAEENSAVNNRRIQEDMENYLQSGMLKLQAIYHKAVYDSYRAVGFDASQAMDLLFFHMETAEYRHNNGYTPDNIEQPNEDEDS